MSWIPVVGLEVHAQLATRTKLFCGCPARFGDPPNRDTCPVCTGQPGALPVPNAEAVRLAVRAGLALGCEIDLTSRFDRKNYFYCDLPKGYQITQLFRPYALGGGVTLDSQKRIRLVRIHLEEDAGKAIHDRGDRTLVDLNRAGVPLIESVTEPDLASADEAVEYLTKLRETLRFAGVSDGDMEKGSLRCDVNVSLHRAGEPLGTKVELKNLNSFRHVRDAIAYEVERQSRALDAGESIVQETRLWDADRGESRTMRTKEDAHDYRYFPEPDLPPLSLDEAWLATVRAELPESAPAKRARYVAELGLTDYDSGVLTADPAIARYFETTVDAVGAERAKDAANWVANDVLAAASDGLEAFVVAPATLGALLDLVDEGVVHRGGAKEVLAALVAGRGTDPAALARDLGLELVRDEGAVEALCREALVGREAVAAEVRGGNQKALGALIGPVLKASAGSADPKQVRATLLRLIEEGA